MTKQKSFVIACFVWIAYSMALMMPGTAFGQDTKTAEELSAMVEANPDSLELHQQYIETVGIDDSNVIAQYERWLKEFPESAIVPYAIGSALAYGGWYHEGNKKPEKAKYFLTTAVERDPDFAEAWASLTWNAEFMGNFKASRQYLGKAAAAEPDNPDYAFYYAMKFEDVNFDKYKRKSLEIVERFPNSERAAQALYWLAYNLPAKEKRMDVYEKLFTQFPPKDSRWSASGMFSYFNLLLKEQPDKALEVAKQMIKQLPDSNKRAINRWTKFKQTALNLKQVHTYFSSKQYSKAAAMLDSTSLGRYNPAEQMFTLLETKALHLAHKTEAAYDSLIIYYSKTPSDEVYSSLVNYGTDLDKTESEVKKDIWRQLEKNAEEADDFKFKKYIGEGYATLDDYKGQVLLMTYWYPGCGPCRGEFPHFENALAKFSDKEVAYIGVNIVPEQDNYVVPFIKSSGYSFTPLHYDSDYKGNLKSLGYAPLNFLVGPDGNIVYSHFRVDGDNERMLELMIQTLLEKNS